MIAAPELLARLDELDRENPKARFEGPDAHLAASSLPQLRQLKADLDKLGEGELAKVETIMRDLLSEDTSWIERWIDDLAASAVKEPLAILPLINFGSSQRAGMQLLRHRLVRLSLTVLPREQLIARKQAGGPRSVIFPGTVSIQRFIRSGGATLSLWQAPRADDEFCIDGPARCRIVGERKLEDGATLRMDGRYETYSIASADSTIMVVQAEILTGRSGLLIEYDDQSRTPIAASSTDDGSSRSQMLLTFLRSQGRSRDRKIIAKFSEDERFFVRWHAVREWLLADPEAALPQLRRMSTSDPHPDIRETASEIVTYFDRTGTKETVPCRA